MIASIIAYYKAPHSLRETGRKFGLSKQQVHTIIRQWAPELIRKNPEKRANWDEIARLWGEKKTFAQIAREIRCDDETVRYALITLGLYKPRPYTRPVRPAMEAADEPPCGQMIAEWPIGIHFDSLTFKPSIQRKPVMPEANSGCGNSSAMVLG